MQAPPARPASGTTTPITQRTTPTDSLCFFQLPGIELTSKIDELECQKSQGRSVLFLLFPCSRGYSNLQSTNVLETFLSRRGLTKINCHRSNVGCRTVNHLELVDNVSAFTYLLQPHVPRAAPAQGRLESSINPIQ